MTDWLKIRACICIFRSIFVPLSLFLSAESELEAQGGWQDKTRQDKQDEELQVKGVEAFAVR